MKAVKSKAMKYRICGNKIGACKRIQLCTLLKSLMVSKIQCYPSIKKIIRLIISLVKKLMKRSYNRRKKPNFFHYLQWIKAKYLLNWVP